MESKAPAQSIIVGTFLMFIGAGPFTLWLLDLVGVVILTRSLPEWSVILMTIFGLGVGLMLIKGEGKGISEAFMSSLRWMLERRKTEDQ